MAKMSDLMTQQRKSDLECLNSMVESKHRDLTYSDMLIDSSDLLD